MNPCEYRVGGLCSWKTITDAAAPRQPAKNFLPFSEGTRNCIGQVTTLIMQNLEV